MFISETRDEYSTYVHRPENEPKYPYPDSYYRKPPSHYNEGYNYEPPFKKLNYSNYLDYSAKNIPHGNTYSNNHYLTNNHINYNNHGQFQPYNGHQMAGVSHYDPKYWWR